MEQDGNGRFHTGNLGKINIAGEQVLQTEALEELSAAHNYRRTLVRMSLSWLGEHAIEVGSGNGDYARTWADFGVRLTATEAFPDRIDELRERLRGEPLVDVAELCLPAVDRADYSAAIAYNVLEHIEDDIGAIKAMGRLVRPSGYVVLLVPAFSIAMSEFDRRLGHFRRYRIRDLDQKLRIAGLEPIIVRYVNFLGLLAWIVLVRGLRQMPRNTFALRAYDRWVIPSVSAIESRIRLPFGQSVFAVARLPGSK